MSCGRTPKDKRHDPSVFVRQRSRQTDVPPSVPVFGATRRAQPVPVPPKYSSNSLFPGNDYGVCCPASLKISKEGACPKRSGHDCGQVCGHDLECPSVQKCCDTEDCGTSCVHPTNVTGKWASVSQLSLLFECTGRFSPGALDRTLFVKKMITYCAPGTFLSSECIHQKALSEVLVVSERAGRGYVPQCTATGQFEPRQCSRNGLVCWCVDKTGRKIRGSMGAAETVNCTETDGKFLI